MVAWTLPAGANPMKVKDVVGPAGFRKGSTVTVYIDVDPLSKLPKTNDNYIDRVPDAVGGINGWVQPLKDAGNITLNVVKLDAEGKDPATGRPPDLAQAGTVHLVWQPSAQIKQEGTDGNAQAYATPPLIEGPDDGKGHLTNGEATTGAVIHLADDASANPKRSHIETKKNAAHEMGHVIGLDHSDAKATGNVMYPVTDGQPDDGSPSADDIKELKNVYASASGPDPFHVIGTGTAVALGDGLYQYSYTLDYISGPDLGLFQVGFGSGASIFNVMPPPGWEWLRNGDVLSFDPTFLNGQVPYLNADNLEVSFRFTSNGPPELDSAWVGDLTQLVAPAAVPEPSTLVMAVTTGLVGLAYLWRRQRAAT
jgi:hypothetical protein